MHNVNIHHVLLVFLTCIHLQSTDGGFACLSNPCIHGVCLDDLNTTYSCYCIDGYTGVQCQTNWDECWSNPCQNGGICTDGIAAFNCTCAAGFAGDLCEEDLNECLSNPCLNNATCLDAANGYVCSCPAGYAGVHCEQDVAVCNASSEARCANGGVCVEGPGFAFNCRCPHGWTGLLCELEIDECMSHPCQNGAVCVDLLADYECACAMGFAGRHCEEAVMICEDSPCRNEALCLMEEDRPVCYCVPDYHGERCQLQYDECKLSNNRCLNGGSCIDGVDGFTCSCPPKLTGVYCECLIVELQTGTYLDCNYMTSTTTTANITCITESVTPTPTETTTITTPSTSTTTTSQSTTETTPVTLTPITSTEVTTQTPTSEVPKTETTLTTLTMSTTSTENTTMLTSTTEATTTTSSGELITYASTTQQTTITPTVTTEEVTSSSSTHSSTETETVSPSMEQSTETPTTVTTVTTVTIPGENLVTITKDSKTERPTETTSEIVATTLTTDLSSNTETSSSSVTTSTPLKQTDSTFTSTSAPTYTTSELTSTLTPITLSQPDTTSSESITTETTISTSIDTTTEQTSTKEKFSTMETTSTPIQTTPSMTPTEETTVTTVTTVTVEDVITSEKTKTETTEIPTTETTTIETTASSVDFPSITDFPFNVTSQITETTTDLVTFTTLPEITVTKSVTTSEVTDTIQETTPVGPPFDCSKWEQSCLNGGTCIYSEGFRCSCSYDFTGERCEVVLGIKNAAFNGHSYILHKMQTHAQIEVEFAARTSWESGVLFYAHVHDTYMALYMEHAHLKFKFSCGFQTMLLSELNKPVNNGNAMRINALLTFSNDHRHCNASIKLNDTLTMSGAQTAHFNLNNLFRVTSYLYLGGLNEKTNAMWKLPGFIGCMSDLYILGKSVRIFKDAEDAYGVSECSSLACLANPCRNGATCAALPGKGADQYFCKCTNGYVGKECENSVCANNPCQFGGICLPYTGSGYLCLCPYGKHGHFCENDLKISKAYYSSSVQGYSSFTTHPIPKTPNKSMYIRFKITPSNLNQIAILMFIGQEGAHDFYSSHMAVSFVKGYIMLTWNLGAGPRRIFTSKPIAADKASYEIQLGRVGRRAWLHVEHIGNVTGRSQGSSTQLDVEPVVYFGGYKTKYFDGLPHDLPLHSGFAGCMFDMEFKVADVTILLENGPIAGRAVGQCGTTECYEGVCQNKGACLYHGGTFTCICQDGFYGPLCSSKHNPCDENSCAPNAICSPMIAGYECDCPLGKKGRYCHQNETISDIRFTGTRSYLILPARHFEVNKLNFNIELRPLQDGLVAFIGNQDYFLSLTLQSSLLELRILPSRLHLSKHEMITLRSNKLLRLGIWHQIKIQIYGRKVYLFVDNVVNTAILHIGDSLDLSNEVIYLGGLPDLSLLPPAASGNYPTCYKGCIRRLFIDTLHIVLNAETILRAQNVEDCDGTPCGGDYCANGGTCWLDPNLQPHCNCPDPFYGDKCTQKYNCIEHKCTNNGYCLDGRCVCRVGYIGALCETGLTIRTPKFIGKSYLYVNVSQKYPPPIETVNKKRNSLATSTAHKNITIKFVTISDGLILFANLTNWLLIGLVNGKLNLIDRNQQVEISSNRLIDGLEHELHFCFLPFRVYVDGKEYGVGNFSYVQFDDFYLGGVPVNVTGFGNPVEAVGHFGGFHGCIDQLRISNSSEIVDFNGYSGENVDECLL